jgi:hypothetical protein
MTDVEPVTMQPYRDAVSTERTRRTGGRGDAPTGTGARQGWGA